MVSFGLDHCKSERLKNGQKYFTVPRAWEWMSERESEQARTVERVKSAMLSKRASERYERMNKQTRVWPITKAPMSRHCESLWRCRSLLGICYPLWGISGHFMFHEHRLYINVICTRWLALSFDFSIRTTRHGFVYLSYLPFMVVTPLPILISQRSNSVVTQSTEAKKV